MLIKYRFKTVERREDRVYAVIERLADLVFFDRLRTPTQKAWDVKLFSEEECRRTIEEAQRELRDRPQGQTFKAQYVIEQMKEAISAIQAYR